MDSEYFGMLKEDKSAVANLPQQVIQKTFPRCKYLSEELDDTMNVLDESRDSDIKRLAKDQPDSMW